MFSQRTIYKNNFVSGRRDAHTLRQNSKTNLLEHYEAQYFKISRILKLHILGSGRQKHSKVTPHTTPHITRFFSTLPTPHLTSHDFFRHTLHHTPHHTNFFHSPHTTPYTTYVKFCGELPTPHVM